MLKRVILVLLILTLIFVSACKNNTEEQTTVINETTQTPNIINTEKPSETPTPVETPISEEKKFGEDFIIPDSSVRPVAVMIDNQGSKVLPQGGISQAQIVYEVLTEANITRYMAFFWGTMPDMVGPVRSSRHYFLDYAMEYDAVYTHVGGSEYAKSDIRKLKIQNIDGLVHGKAFWDITNDPKNWQDTYTSKERIEKQIASLKYRTEPKKSFPFTYHDDLTIPENGEKAVEVSIKFAQSGSTCGYLFDSESNLYDRLRMNEPHIERNTNEQVKAANIIIAEIACPLIPGDKEGRRNLKNIGSGKGFYITGGKAVPIKWAKSARDAQTTFTFEDGKPVTLNRGQTWIELVPNLGLVNIK
ncbi:MAG: DUF3048 domain-containing protein [Clostridiaceae bacterium]|nr:DUF3048 domain-containing protein [Clostridiaceae bacterium]